MNNWPKHNGNCVVCNSKITEYHSTLSSGLEEPACCNNCCGYPCWCPRCQHAFLARVNPRSYAVRCPLYEGDAIGVQVRPNDYNGGWN